MEDEGIFYLRPFWFENSSLDMKYPMEIFNIRYEVYYNPHIQSQNSFRRGKTIFDIAKCIGSASSSFKNANNLCPGITYSTL